MDAFAELMRDGASAGLVPLRPLAVQESPLGGATLMEVVTADGIIACIRHGLDDGEPATTIFLGGALGGFSGPASGLYHRLAAAHGGVRVHYRKPGRIEDCVMDVLLVHHILQRRGLERVVLVGHSFGGAVAVSAGVFLGATTAGVVTLSTQVPGTEQVDKLAGRPLLIVHGDADGVLPDLCSRNLHQRAAEPKELVILPGEGHVLAGAGPALVELVGSFIHRALAHGDTGPGSADGG